MKKLLIAVFAVVVALSAGQVFAASYDMGASTQALESGNCATRTISFDGSSCGTSPFVSGGFLLQNSNESAVDITAADCSAAVGSPFDQPVTPVFDPEGFPGGVFVAAANLGAGVTPAPGIVVCTVTFCGVGAGAANLCVDTVPDFDTWVEQDFAVCDPTVPATCVAVTVSVPPCTCSITGPAVVNADATDPVTATYAASGNAQCTNTPVYVYTTDCTNGTIDPNTGVLTVPAFTTPPAENCTITATDTANTDVNTGDPVVCTQAITINPGITCGVQIALGRECPGEAIDDPAYNRPGRRGLAATCEDIIDFTVCSDCPTFDAACLVWTVTPNISGSTITQIDDCCWRMEVGDICDQLEKVVTEVVTVTDTCNNGSDSVEIDIGQIIVDIGETTIQPNTESAALDINLINPNHSVRAITLDIAECDTAYPADNLVCTQCVIDSSRALEYTCSANEQADGSCRVVLYATDPAAVIEQGRGTIAQVLYSAGPEVEPCADAACIDLCAINIKISDQFNEELCPCTQAGEVCFRTCGDIYPQDCLGGDCGAVNCCGDGVIDLFDILEAVDIILNLQVATACQIGNGDVPNGMPPYCGNPSGTPNCETDGDIDIFDVLVMIDKALGKMNCCDYCLFGQIF